MTTSLPESPRFEMIRQELKTRDLVVRRVERLSPAMIRTVLVGEALADFASHAPDDHIKLFFASEDGGRLMRDFTPRRFDPVRRELVLDFVDHEGGPAADWARSVRVGDLITIGGPRGSRALLDPVGSWLLVGDETARPAIGRRLEEFGEGTKVTSVVAVPGAADEQEIATAADHAAFWVHRPVVEADNPVPFLDVLRTLDWTPSTFIWIAAEATVARALKAYVLETRGHGPGWVKSAGYWVKGHPGEAAKDLG